MILPMILPMILRSISSRLRLAPTLLLALSASAAAAAERPGPASAAGMALTLPWQGMALVAVPAQGHPAGFRKAGLVSPAADPIPPAGRLPNQRTGAKRDHVVRDICIGC
ncbi:hypothetical protein [Methylobacterium oxalidis]|uniref:Uncharacterized protein n=1 Tax=Methylobacterium oxalidis TaxID=944322 RepID=A0A512IX22_9HYPH|nr:hypothetical protein [Methylobacterium oxalidis]GEP02226.1 hypothetical protein MOX02_02640 [Methylobacterium oxalidis]GJE32218.1 hypothetical protein LDDCCGHA_2402 [Methylobacterium oxalidis]GLS62171.1 hypothetical protein GCM10007888_05520 [Methylobacterium oxalidis]